MNLPALRTERLVLQPFSIDDVDRLHQLWIDPDVRRYLWDDQAITRERADETVRQSVANAAREGLGMWTVRDRTSGELAGFCGFIRRERDDDPELLYGLAPKFWKQGLATEAARAAMGYAFETLACERLSAATDPPNIASLRVMERLGFSFARRGTLNGLDTLFYSIDRSTFTTAYTVRR